MTIPADKVRFPSPFLYPGGKAWFVDDFMRWQARFPRPHTVYEPFAGGATIGLTMLLSGRCDCLVLTDTDPDIAAFWRVAASPDGFALADAIEATALSYPKLRVQRQIRREADPLEYARSVLVNNRTAYGGNMATGGVISAKKLAEVWKPTEYAARVRAVAQKHAQIEFYERSALDLMAEVADDPGGMSFVDPPYIFSMTRPADVLYKTIELTPEALFTRLDALRHPWLMTTDCGHATYRLAHLHGMKVHRLTMHNVNNNKASEAIVTREPF